MENTGDSGSRDVARAALSLSLSASREEESQLRDAFARDGVLTAAADYGGEYNQSIMKLIERAVACKNILRHSYNNNHTEEMRQIGNRLHGTLKCDVDHFIQQDCQNDSRHGAEHQVDDAHGQRVPDTVYEIRTAEQPFKVV